MTELEVTPEGERELVEMAATPALMLALNGSQGAGAQLVHPPGIKFRWSPALVAQLAKVNEHSTRWKEEPQWLRLMPALITWRVL